MCYQHGYSWPSLSIHPYRLLLLADPQGYIPYRYRAAVCRIELVIQPLLISVKGVHRGTFLMNLSLLLQDCPACLVRLILIVSVMGGRIAAALWGSVSWTYSILLAAFLCNYLIVIHVVHPYSSIDTIAPWKKLRLILSVRSDFHMTESLSIAVHAFGSHLLMSVSVDVCLGWWDTTHEVGELVKLLQFLLIIFLLKRKNQLISLSKVDKPVGCVI